MRNMITISSIIENCGGKSAIAKNARGLSADAVRKWNGVGIPERHWAVIMKLHKGRLTEKMLHEMNEALRLEAVA